MAELVPYPFAALARRMFRELERNDAIFDLPTRKFFGGATGKDLGARFHGRRASSPLGPAAGPQTQMAQNIVLSWLGGCRIMELKTVQIDDRLEIPRPCIDMQTIGYNAEWSQELRLAESLGEYVKGAMLVEMLRASGRIPLADDFGDTIYDMSVGYDLAGIRSAPVENFIHGMMDARETIERFRGEIPRELGPLRDLDFPARLSESITLSTFHGCPPDEIERIIEFLMRELGVSCIIKFNPMLLGPDEARHLLCDVLGYSDIRVPDRAFANDTTWEQAVEIMERLGALSDSLGLSLGAKFSNTLIVENHRGFLPDDLPEVYLSGPPLHVLAMSLVRRFRARFGDRFPVSFSAGIDRRNFADAVSLGLTPITICSDLLKTGGYGRLVGYQRDLLARMESVGASSTSDLVLRAYGLGSLALDRVERLDSGTRTACLAALENGGDLRATGGDCYERWVSEAKLLNTDHYLERVTADPRYARAKNTRVPKKIGRRLRLFDCVSCDICVPVCPNDANFTFGSGEATIPVAKARRADGAWEWHESEGMALVERHQIGTFADFCNECGNCDVFCPEDGGPYVMKPRFFGSEAAWRKHAALDGFFLTRRTSGELALGRFGGVSYRVERREGRVTYEGADFSLTYSEADPKGTLEGRGPDEVDLTYCAIMCYLLTTVLDERRVNAVNALVS